MELRTLLMLSTHILLSCLTINGSPLSSSSSSTSSSSSSSINFSVTSDTVNCQPATNKICSNIYQYVAMPNIYGDVNQENAEQRLEQILAKFSQRNDLVVTFFCTVYMPPCPEATGEVNSGNRGSGSTFLPCRSMCELAAKEGRGLVTTDNGRNLWPVTCTSLPSEHCYTYNGPKSVKLVKTSINALPSRLPSDGIMSFAPLEVELGNDEGYEVEVVSMSDNQIPERRYDIADLGDPTLFQGWTDVQGSGAANDYCRIVGKNKRKFMSCNLAGSTGQGHDYVSKLGLDVGHPNTWFMRDMDGDGRDDYCRCVGTKSNSKMSCMKAGERGFYGSITQGGNQHTFILPGSEGCYNKKVNPMFGERQP